MNTENTAPGLDGFVQADRYGVQLAVEALEHFDQHVYTGDGVQLTIDAALPLLRAALAAKQPAASGEPAALNSHERYWVQIRHKVVAALAAEGLRILSDKNRVWLERVGKVTAQGGPASTMGGASHG